MAGAMVKRLDSAYMKFLYEKALDTADADFLISNTEVTIEQVRKLQLEGDDQEKQVQRPQSKPPQPPKQRKPHRAFSLTSFEFLVDEGDAESWLVPSPFDGESSALGSSAPVQDTTKAFVGSPLESSVSSVVSRSTCKTPASVLESRHTHCGKTSDGFEDLPIFRSRSVEPYQSRLLPPNHEDRDIRNLPRTVGCIKHTPAPAKDSNLRPPKATVRTVPQQSVFTLEISEAEQAPVKKGLASKLKGRISSVTQKEANKSSVSALSGRPKSVGPVRRDRLRISSPVSRPKSSLGKTQTQSKGEESSLRAKNLPSPPPLRPRSSFARPSSSLGTVKEERNEGKKLLGFRKTASSPLPRPKSSIGRAKDSNNAIKRPSGISRIASPAPRLSLPIENAKSSSTAARRPTGNSRIASPSLRPPTTATNERAEIRKTKKTTDPRTLAASMPPRTQESARECKADAKVRRKRVTKKA